MISVIISFLIILVLQLATPFWWWTMLVPLIMAVILAKSGWDGFRIGAFSAGGLWLLASVYYWLTGSAIIASRVADMMSVGTTIVVLLATGLVAAIAAGVAGLTGYYVRTIFRR